MTIMGQFLAAFQWGLRPTGLPPMAAPLSVSTK